MNKESYKKQIDSINFSDNLEDRIKKHLIVSQTVVTKPHVIGKLRIWIPVFLAVASIAVIAIITSFHKNQSDFTLLRSKGKISVSYLQNAPSVTSSSLISLSEDEIFQSYNTDIFTGTIQDIENIKIKFNDRVEYCSIIKVTVNKVLKGNVMLGNTVSILISAPINTEIYVEDTEVTSRMRTGMTAIFMAYQYDESHYRSENNTTLYWMDLAEYGLMDYVRFVFLQTEDGLVYSTDTFSELSANSTLTEVEDYILEKLH